MSSFFFASDGGRKEDEGGRTGDQALNMREFGWRTTLVVMMNLYDILVTVTGDTVEGDR